MKAREGLFCSPMPWCLRTDVYRLSARHATSNNGRLPAGVWLGGVHRLLRPLDARASGFYNSVLTPTEPFMLV